MNDEIHSKNNSITRAQEIKHNEAKRLSEILSMPVEVVQSMENGAVMLVAPRKSTIEYDKENDVILSDDPHLIRLVILLTNGKKDRIKAFIDEPNTRKAMLRDSEGWVRMKLVAYYLAGALEEVPRDMGRRLLELIRDYAPQTGLGGKPTRKPVSKSKPTESKTDTTLGAARDILGMGKARKKTRK